VQPGERRLRLGGAEEARGARPLLAQHGEAARGFEDALAHCARRDVVVDRVHLEEDVARRSDRAARDRHHGAVQQPDGDVLLVADLPHQRHHRLEERLGGVELALDAR
jgi:hypothetical protein